MKERLGAEHYGAERQETAEARAEGIVAEELKRRRWREKDLGRRSKGDAVKVSVNSNVVFPPIVGAACHGVRKGVSQ